MQLTLCTPLRMADSVYADDIPISNSDNGRKKHRHADHKVL